MSLAHLRLRHIDLGARRIIGGLRRVQFALGHQFSLFEFLGPFQSPIGILQRDFRLRQAGLGGQHIGAGLFDARGKARLIELSDDLPFRNFAVVVGD